MSEFNRSRVPVSEEDKKKSYFKYYGEPMVPGDPKKFEKVLSGPIDPSKALPFAQRNRLFEPGYLEEELGYCIMPDGMRMPPMGPMSLLMHNIKEFTNLAALLPPRVRGGKGQLVRRSRNGIFQE